MRNWIAAVAGLVLAGCASAPEWRHDDLSGPEAERALLIADGRCTKEAAAIALPDVPAVQPAYSVSGTSQTTGPSGTSNTRVAAEARPQSGPLAIAQHVQASGARGAAEGARRRVYTGCMAEAGWTR